MQQKEEEPLFPPYEAFYEQVSFIQEMPWLGLFRAGSQAYAWATLEAHATGVSHFTVRTTMVRRWSRETSTLNGVQEWGTEWSFRPLTRLSRPDRMNCATLRRETVEQFGCDLMDSASTRQWLRKQWFDDKIRGFIRVMDTKGVAS